MSKFSDLPRFLLDEYFSESVSTSNVNASVAEAQRSYLHGGRGSIVADGGYWEKIWIDVQQIYYEDPEYPGMVQYKFKVESDYRTEDYFHFEYGSLLTLPASANGTFENGSNVYFKKGSYIYEWLVKNSDYKKYFNTNKTWLYFGKIYEAFAVNKYRIIFDGMKNYVMNCLPSHQRTDNLTEFVRLYFDKVHHKVYNMTKNISTLLDPREVNEDWIDYLAKNYNMDTDIGRTGISLIEWVEGLPSLLKRKGTYSSLYIIWKVLLQNTSNDLNIFNRWHVRDLYSKYGIVEPLGHFYDVLHQMTYGYMPTGCSGEYWYRNTLTDLATHEIFHQTSEATVWEVRHWMYTRHMVVQCYDTSYNRIWPKKIEVLHMGQVKITFGKPVAGYAFLESDEDYLHSQDDDSIEWSVAHGQGATREIISQYQTLLYNMILPKDVTLTLETSANGINVDFSEERSGYAVVLRDGVTAITQSTPLDVWNINHGLGTKEMLVQTFDMNNNMIQPYDIHLEDENNCTITWSEPTTASPTSASTLLSYTASGGYQYTVPTSGYAIIKTAVSETSLPDWSDKVLSPHYKVEMDLSCEPLDNDDDNPKIISEETVDRLIEKWEEMRPVTRFSHYHELISPVVDFSGANTSLYGRGYDAFLFSKFCASASEWIPAASASEMFWNQNSHESTWDITHDFGTKNLIVQCYGRDNNRIWPKNITGRWNNQLRIEFDKAVSGNASILSLDVSGSSYTESASGGASSWLINHAMNLKEVISQYDNTSNEKFVPSGVTLQDDNNLLATWTSNVNGMGLISASEVVWLETTPKTFWYVDHRLSSDSVICLFFNDDDQMIQPDNIELSTKNRIIATFPQATSGYAIVRSINKAFLESDIMDNIGYWTLGQGTSGSDYDPVANNNVETFLASGGDFDYDFDDDRYYLTLETGTSDEDWNVTEIAWFDKDGTIRFYTYCSPIHKPKDVWFNSHLRITRL